MKQIPLSFRPFAATDADYDALIAIDQQVWPGEPVSKAALQFDDQHWDPSHFFMRILVEAAGRIIAYGQYSVTPWAYAPNKYFIKIMVLPEHQRQGIGTQLYAKIELELRTRGARQLTATTRTDQAHAIRFLHRHGFHETIRERESRLDVATCDLTAFAAVCDQVAQQGIQIISIRDIQAHEPDWMRKWWELTWTIVPDMPTSEEFTPDTLAEFSETLESPHIDFDAAFVAIDSATSAWVGMSSVLRYPEDPDTLYVGNTGVIRSYRRRGIALALKVQTIAFAQRVKATVIIGENEEHNPMYRLNEKLGFVYRHSWLGFAKEFADDA